MAEQGADLRRAEDRGYEPSDVNIRVVLGIAATFAGVVALSALLLGGLVGVFEVWQPPPSGSALERTELVPPAPRLEVRPQEDLKQVRERESQLLQGYGWIDRDAGVARIPIDRAMAILAERGWPHGSKGPEAR
jgi:hypothetical protein